MGRRRLRSGIPRAYRDHRRQVALAYRDAVAEIQQRLGLTGYTGPLLREYGLIVVELERLHGEAETLQGHPRRRRDLARLQRRRAVLRSQLMGLGARLEELAARQSASTGSLHEYLSRYTASSGRNAAPARTTSKDSA